jgi:hypothetical protein
VWQRLGKKFLKQRKYIVVILQRYVMMDYRSMATPMISNLKKKNEATSNSNFVDPTMYIQLVGYLM